MLSACPKWNGPGFDPGMMKSGVAMHACVPVLRPRKTQRSRPCSGYTDSQAGVSYRRLCLKKVYNEGTVNQGLSTHTW